MRLWGGRHPQHSVGPELESTDEDGQNEAEECGVQYSLAQALTGYATLIKLKRAGGVLHYPH